MKYIELSGSSIKEDIQGIKHAIDENSDIIFIYSGTDTLYDYITALNNKGKGLDAAYLYKLKICYENKNLKISYSKKNEYRKEITSISGLINELDGTNNCRIVIETNDRVQLAFIVQQLIFLEYPLDKIDILLRKEEHDADKTKRFMKTVNKLMSDCNNSIQQLIRLRNQIQKEEDITKTERLKDIEEALESCKIIKSQLSKAMAVELKFAVAASKKAGKSVIVNCFLGEEIAPTSTELATPNNCIYRKSKDGKYHLQLEGSNKIQSFNSRDEIYNVINEHFRNAQNDKEAGFALPNMYIDYVTEENNFSAYTIFDTAGPDAAGTIHAKSANEAMEECDVAIFAIDYSKYLTISEEEYLYKIKSLFKNKFHSLIFALNKIDVRYTDVKSPKSFIMSVDFLKTRLASIDEAYKDCIIFPTCSLEYFSALEAEHANITELAPENNLPIGKMKEVKFAHRNVPSLAWLHTHSENLEYYHDMKTISYDVFKKDSGMTALMNYVSYVAQSKARDEIINSVTSDIALQKAKLQSIIDFISNIETLINVEDEKIAKISDIITEYTENVNFILCSKLNELDLSILEEGSLLKEFHSDYNKLIKYQDELLQDSCKKTVIADMMYHEMVEQLWKNLESYENEINGHQIDSLFTTEDFTIILENVLKIKTDEASNNTYNQLSQIGYDIKRIVNQRQQIIEEESDNCRNKLSKEDVHIHFPTISDFEFDTIMNYPKEALMEVNMEQLNLYQNLSYIFTIKILKNLRIWFLDLLGMVTEKDYKRKVKIDKQTLQTVCDEYLQPRFKNIIYENNVAEELYCQLKDSVIDNYTKNLVEQLQQGFDNINNSFISCIKYFKSAIDDRDKYKQNIEQHSKRKVNITQIDSCTANFMHTWKTIVYNYDKN